MLFDRVRIDIFSTTQASIGKLKSTYTKKQVF